jgi:hypothetical protein
MSADWARFVSAAGRILALAVVFAIVLAGTALPIAFLVSWLQAVTITHGANIYVGLVCGLIVWLFIAVFHLRKETLMLPLIDRSAFVEQVNTALGELGYDLKVQTKTSLWFKPAFRSFLLGGGVQVFIENDAGRITGPRVCLEVIRRRMRIRNHLDSVPQAIQEGRRRHGERLLKRVQFTVRLSGAQWQDAYLHLVEPLAREAAVICELSVLAQSEAGFPDQAVEQHVRPWLHAQEISAEIHKTPLLSPSSSQLIRPELVR